MSLVSPAVEGTDRARPGLRLDLGHMYKHQPGVRAAHLLHPLRGVRDRRLRRQVLRDHADRPRARRDGFVGTANPSSIMKLIEKADESSRAPDPRHPRRHLSEAVLIEPGIRRTLAAQLPAQPAAGQGARGDATRGAAGRLLPADYWPGPAPDRLLEGRHGGRALLRGSATWFDPDGQRPEPVRDWGYLASEMRGFDPALGRGQRRCAHRRRPTCLRVRRGRGSPRTPTTPAAGVCRTVRRDRGGPRVLRDR